MSATYYDVIWFHQYNQDWHTETFDTLEEAEARAEEIRS